MKSLTEKQESILLYIEQFIKDNGYSPTASEVKNGFGYSSETAARQHIEALERKGYIKTTPKIARSIVVLQA